ncbi:S-adenosyl-L-methionine-dependent methyltransferase [Cladochytrium replicatum]|nr:S-adenosyl-L-methionine-dependent methyltransferase [Cladochytrium replicatum]
MGIDFSKQSIEKLKVDLKAASHWTVPTESDDVTTDGSSQTGSQTMMSDDSRTYHSVKTSPYMIPADVREGQRLNLHHHLIRQLFHGANTGGIPEQALMKGLSVLDVGFGTGLWLAEMNRDYPQGTYYGVDLIISTFAETFRDLADVGKINLTQGNVYERLPYKDDMFDYIHMQDINSGIPERLWPHAINELCRILKPGGFLDLVEAIPVAIPTGKPSPISSDSTKSHIALMQSRGINVRFAHKLPTLLQQNSLLDNVQMTRRTAPLGWDGQIGHLWASDAKKAYEAVSDFICSSVGLTREQWLERVELIANGWKESKSFINVVEYIRNFERLRSDLQHTIKLRVTARKK